MTGIIDKHLSDLNIELPEPPAPTGNIQSYAIDNGIVYLSGKPPKFNGELRYKGKVGNELTLEEAQDATRICALNLIAVLRKALNGDLDRVLRIVKVVGFVNADPGFEGVAKAVDGASNLFIEVFEDKGEHARSTMGVSTLPGNAAAVVEAIVRIDRFV